MSRPELDGLMQSAQQAQAQGRIAEAESFCDQALALDPGFVPAKVAKGGLAMQKGDRERGLALFQEAAEADPRNPQPLLGLVTGLRESRRLTEAQEAAQRLTQAFPNFAQGLDALGSVLNDAGKREEALDSFRKAVALNPSLTIAHFHLGSALQTLGRRNEAIAAYRKGIETNPDAVNCMANLGQILMNKGDLEEAIQLGRRLVERWPRFAPGHLLLGQCLMEKGEYQEAEAEIRQAIQIGPRDPYAQQALAFLLIDQGRTDEAKSPLQASIDLLPNQGGAYYYLFQLKKADDSDRQLLDRLETMLKAEALVPLEQEYLHFALGKGYDDLGQWGEAMGHFEEGHHISHSRATAERPYDREADAREKRRLLQILDEPFLDKHRGVGVQSDVPIFICGMIRSGTTLMEQIVSSHPQVGAAGEQTFWNRNWWTALDRHSARLDVDKLRRITDDYLQTLRDAAPGQPRITDKMPGNVLSLGLIHLALPNAKILHMQRHPVDTCLSILTTRFTQPPEFASTKAELVFQYRLYLEVVEHWRKVLPPQRFMDVRYEQLIEDPETMTRKILEFLGLPWDEACLRHDQNTRSVKTPSVWKVRQPLYKSSMERWRRYEPWLGELAELLPAGSGQ